MSEPIDLTGVLDAIASGVLAVDSEGLICFANRAACLALRRQPAEVVGHPLTELLQAPRELREALAGRGLRESLHEVSWADGSGEPQRLGLTVVHPEAATWLGTVVLFRDVYQRRELDQELRRRERFAALGRMVGGLAHELRNPLAALQALTEGLLAELEPSREQTEYGSRIVASIKRMDSFVRAAAEFADPQQSPPIRVAAMELFVEAAGRVLGAGNAPALQVSAAEGSGLSCEVDPGQVVRTLAELIANALDAAGSPAGVRLQLERSTDWSDRAWARFIVSDQGPGISDEALPNIFEPFYSTKPARTGMGLAFAQSFAQANGGRIEVQASPGAGATFALWLPEAAP